jgi:methionine-rich copper-binding protein CopC
VIPRLPLAFVAGCLLTLSLAAVAAAHASLVESEPMDEGSLERTPATLSALFDEELDRAGSSIFVRNEAREEVASGGVSPENEFLMEVELPALPPGEYEALWTARTPDDLAVTRGTFTFTIEQPPVTPTPASTPTAVPTEERPAPTPTAGPTPTPTSSPSPSPAPADDEPTTGTTDLLLALVLAGAVVGGLALYLLRRR